MRATGFAILFMSVIEIVGCANAAVDHPTTQAASTPDSGGSKSPQRKLRVALYPYVPNYNRILEHARRQLTDLEIVEVGFGGNYYKSEQPSSAMHVDADVVELDSVFMNDAIASGRIRALPTSLRIDARDFAPAAVTAARRQDKWYGVPHWQCGNFVFTTKDRAAGFSTLANIESTIGKHHERHHGLLMDAKGGTTLGEMFFDAGFDEYAGDMQKLLSDIEAAARPDQAADNAHVAKQVANLNRLLALCDPGDCRTAAGHNEPATYARRFARGEGVAYVGYSEMLYFILKEVDACERATPGKCLKPDNLAVVPLALSDHGSKPFAWIDSLAITSACERRPGYPECVDDAARFIAAVASDDELVADLSPVDDRDPALNEPPQYLMPARQTVNARLDAVAPFYKLFRPLLVGAVAVVADHLGDRLRGACGNVDKWLAPPN